VILSSALRRVEQGDVAELLRDGMGQVEREIENLRAIITELRPAALDELGLVPAIESLVARVSAVEGLTIECAVSLPTEGERLGQELETTVYRLVQEALTNVAKHARAEHARVTVGSDGGRLEIEIADDGEGFDPVSATSGFGEARLARRDVAHRLDELVGRLLEHALLREEFVAREAHDGGFVEVEFLDGAPVDWRPTCKGRGHGTGAFLAEIRRRARCSA
jgi:signal transduction histidine kinase